MNISITVGGVCDSPTNKHITMTAHAPNGKSKTFHVTKDDFIAEPDNFEEAIIVLLRNFYKKNSLGQLSNAQIKAAIEAEIFVL